MPASRCAASPARACQAAMSLRCVATRSRDSSAISMRRTRSSVRSESCRLKLIRSASMPNNTARPPRISSTVPTISDWILPLPLPIR